MLNQRFIVLVGTSLVLVGLIAWYHTRPPQPEHVRQTLRTLDTMERKWHDQNIHQYRLTVRVMNPLAQYRSIVEVKHGNIVRHDCQDTYLFGGRACQDAPPLTVPELFAQARTFPRRAEEAITEHGGRDPRDKHPAPVPAQRIYQITFDDQYGYPNPMRYDYPFIRDDDWYYTVEQFEILP